MEKIIAVTGLILLASQLVSWANPTHYELDMQWHRVKAGETLWSISCDYFDYQQKFKNFNEWYYEVRQANDQYKYKHLQIGDVVNIPLNKKCPNPKI
jgi:hypothetical protein